ncbi:hypothetical protein GCM10022393_21770 [Aquimarina addita]|uniref:Outer membrane protein beta-barrel domain-containing protein n=1 Tax=Aquimarina addita TaxID=870485 RepID=A0ABP6UL77_9FLAO
MNKKLLILLLGISSIVYGQDLDQIGKVPLLRFNGGISGNAVYYNGTANRDPFTYFVNGNLNFDVSGIYSIPLSFSYTNQDFGYSTPFKINRLSIHPSYKWIATHIGDVAMTFSPYTVNGHQFTGGGIDLTPNGPFKLSALYGRFLKESEYNPELPEAIPAYKRMGLGIKASYDFEEASLALIFFSAKDDEASLENPLPATLELTPKENAVLSATTNFTLLEKATFNLEYAISGITEDTRVSEPRETAGTLLFILNENLTTSYYNAFNAQFKYPAGNGSVGAGYERIDPDYRTFGAYYFNNDMENITINAAQSVLNNTLNLSVNAGLQRDNLDKTKSSEMQRIVSAFTLNYAPSEKLSINAGYSNFQSYTNIRDQFDYINEVNQFENVDTLNYRQVSQNANLGANYTLKKTENKQQNLQANITYQVSDNQQNGETIENGLSNFYNLTSGYIMGYPKKSLNISATANVSYNKAGTTDNLTLGPTVTVSKSFFDKKLRGNFSSSYNSAFSNGEKQNDIYNIRLGGNYTLYESHNLTLNLLSLFRNTAAGSATDFTATFGYTYAFDTFKVKFNKRKKELMDDERIAKLGYLQFRHRSATYSGTIPEITDQLRNVKNSSRFQNIPVASQKDINFLFEELQKQTKQEPYKELALAFLDGLYSYEDFLNAYDTSIYEVIQRIKSDMQRVDFTLEKSFVKTKIALDKQRKEPISPAISKKINELEKELNDRQKKLVGHRWMKKKFETYSNIEAVKNPDTWIAQFKKTESKKTFDLYEEEKDLEKINLYLETQIIHFYYNRSLEEVNPDTFELKYIDKI